MFPRSPTQVPTKAFLLATVLAESNFPVLVMNRMKRPNKANAEHARMRTPAISSLGSSQRRLGSDIFAICTTGF
jgi:hypothetical protein